MKLSIRVIRKMVQVSIALILFSNIVSWIEDNGGRTIGIIWGLVTAALAFYCRSRATGEIKTNRKYYIWLLLPVTLTVIAIGFRLKTVFELVDKSWLVRVWEITPIFLSLIVPVALLWTVYSALEAYHDAG